MEPSAHDGNAFTRGSKTQGLCLSHTCGVSSLCRQHCICVPTGQALTELWARPGSWIRLVQDTDGTRVRELCGNSPRVVKQGWSPNCPCLEDVDANLGEQREPPGNRPRGQASTTVPEPRVAQDTRQAVRWETPAETPGHTQAQ